MRWSGAMVAGTLMLFGLAGCGPKAPPPPGKTATSAPAVSEQGFVYTANERGRSISAITLRTGQVRTIAMPFMPHNVQVSSDGRLLLALGSAAEMDATDPAMSMADGSKMVGGRLLMIDTETLAVQSAVDLEVGRHPAHVIIDASGQRVYVSNSADNNVAVIDVARQKVIGEIKTGNFPHGLRISPNGREMYVACVNDNSLTVIDVTQSKAVARIAVGQAPVQVGFTPDGRRAYVSLRDENKVAVIDTARRTKTAAIAVGRAPIQVFVTPDGRYVYVANQGTAERPDNTVSVVDVATNSVTATIETGQGAHGVVVSTDGTRAYIANMADSTVSVIETATHQVLGNIPVGDGPNGITFRGATR